MKRFVPVLCAAMILGFSASPAMADSLALREALPQLNRIKPLQNPRFMKSEAVLGRSVIDREAKVVGKVDDVLITPQGDIQSLMVDFDQLRLSQPVPINYASGQVIVASNGFKIGYEAQKIAAMYPEFLADIETASGPDAGVVSLKSILDMDVLSGDSAVVIGKVEDVLIKYSKSRDLKPESIKAEALYITMGFDTEGLAVPLDVFTFAADSTGKLQARIEPEDAELLQKYSR